MMDPKISKWYGEDKVLHFLLGFFIAAFGGWPALLLAAFGKEIWDEHDYSGADYKDLLVTLLGGSIALFL